MNLAAARELVTEAEALRRQLRSPDAEAAMGRLEVLYPGLGQAFDVLLADGARDGRLERAATILGFAEAAIEGAGGEWPPDERQQRDGTIATLEAGLEPGVLAAARSAGRAMGTEDGVAFATSAVAGAHSA